jgi:hypothetical protein
MLAFGVKLYFHDWNVRMRLICKAEPSRTLPHRNFQRYCYHNWPASIGRALPPPMTSDKALFRSN